MFYWLSRNPLTVPRENEKDQKFSFNFEPEKTC